MKTTDQLFADPDESNSFLDTACEALGLDHDTISDQKIRRLFEILPTHIQDIAHLHGLSDSPFRDEAYVWLSQNLEKDEVRALGDR